MRKEKIDQLIRYVKGVKWKIENKNYEADFGLTIYSGLNNPIFQLFNRAAIMEGIYTSVTLSSDDCLIENQDPKKFDQLYSLMLIFFSANYLTEQKGKVSELSNTINTKRHSPASLDIKEKGNNGVQLVFMEETNHWRAILLICPQHNLVKLSITEREEVGVFLPIHAWIDKSVKFSKKNTLTNFDKATQMIKRNEHGANRNFNHEHKYEFWYYRKNEDTKLKEIIDDCQTRMNEHFYGLYQFLKELYGVDPESQFNEKEINTLNEYKRKSWVKFDLPEAKITLIRTLQNTVVANESLGCRLQIEIVPRVLKNENKGTWVVDRLYKK
jgi:hypothetical protein